MLKQRNIGQAKLINPERKVQCSTEDNLEKWAKLRENRAVMRSAARLQQDDGLIFRITVPPPLSVGVTLHGFSHRTSLSRSYINLKCQLSLTKTYVLPWAAEQKLTIYSAGKAQLSRSTCNQPSWAWQQNHGSVPCIKEKNLCVVPQNCNSKILLHTLLNSCRVCRWHCDMQWELGAGWAE